MSITQLPPAHTMTPEQALASAQQEAGDLKRVLIIGEYDNGDLFVTNSRLSCAEALWLIKRAEQYTLDV